MIGQYRITAKLMEVNEEKRQLHISVKTETLGELALLRTFQAETFLAIIKAMKDANKSAFYEAMVIFANENLDDAAEWMEERLKDD